MEGQVLNYKYVKGVHEVYPAHSFVKHWLFKAEEKEEACLANALAILAEKNGMTVNDLSHLFPAILRMLKSDIKWAK